MSMMRTGLYTLFSLAFPNPYIQFLYLLSLSAILTWLFLTQRLNPFINAALSILGFALELFVDLCFRPIGWAGTRIEKHVTNPVRSVTKRIHIHPLVKALLYATLGIGVFALDHKYAIEIFKSDETFAMYPMEINGMKFWVSEAALWIGGFFIGVSALYTVGWVLKALNRLLDRTVRFNIVFYR